MKQRPASIPDPSDSASLEAGGVRLAGGDLERVLKTAHLLGVPAAHLTRPVQGALLALAGEVDALRRQVSDLKETLAEAEAAADYDPLTPVYNRRAFMREASRVLAMVRRHEVEASLIFFDLDRFKEINDGNGHAAGDAALLHVADILVGHTRETDIVGRLGGDEFAVVLTHLHSDAAETKAEALAEAIGAAPVHHEGRVLGLGASIGVAHFRSDMSIEQLLEAADEAMFVRKARKGGAAPSVSGSRL